MPIPLDDSIFSTHPLMKITSRLPRSPRVSLAKSGRTTLPIPRIPKTNRSHLRPLLPRLKRLAQQPPPSIPTATRDVLPALSSVPTSLRASPPAVTQPPADPPLSAAPPLILPQRRQSRLCPQPLQRATVAVLTRAAKAARTREQGSRNVPNSSNGILSQTLRFSADLMDSQILRPGLRVNKTGLTALGSTWLTTAMVWIIGDLLAILSMVQRSWLVIPPCMPTSGETSL